MEKYEALVFEFDVQTLMENLITYFKMRWNIRVRGCGGGSLKKGNSLENVSVTGRIILK